MKKQGPVYTFAVRFTGKQAKAIESVAKVKGISPEAMVRQAVRDALDKAANKPQDSKHLESYVLKLLGNRPKAPTATTATSRQALEKRVLSVLHKDEPEAPKKKPRR